MTYQTAAKPEGPSRRYLAARGLLRQSAAKVPRISKAERRSMAYILSRYEPELNTGCWLWSGGTDRHGYGTQWVAGRVVYAHRIFYEQHVGAIPDGQVVRHKCDTPTCVNPAHLLPGTQGDNMRDARERGRALWKVP